MAEEQGASRFLLLVGTMAAAEAWIDWPMRRLLA